MKKNGFTLTEILAVIALMAILAVIAVPIITNIRKDVIEKTYNSKLENVLDKAKEWGHDHLNTIGDTCTYITVGNLIANNYIEGDKEKKTVLSDPRNNGSMNNIKVCVKYTKNSEGKWRVTANIE